VNLWAETARTLGGLSVISIVAPSPHSSDHAVNCLVDGENILETLGGLGLDPDDFFSLPIAIAAGTPRDARIGRCECGAVGSGDWVIRIVRKGARVFWRANGRVIRFDARRLSPRRCWAASLRPLVRESLWGRRWGAGLD
jgi:hypothetical protein